MKPGRSILMALFLIAIAPLGAVRDVAAQTTSVGSGRGAEEKLEVLIQKLSSIEKRLDQVEARLNGEGKEVPGSTASNPIPVGSNDLADELEALDQKIRIVERKREIEQEDAAARFAATPIVAAGTDGFVLQSGNGEYRLAFGMAAQADGRFSLDDPKPITNTFTIRKIRPTFTGRVAKYFDFKVMPDFGSGTTIVQDAYFDIRFSPKFRIRTGKDKTPIGYELLQGDTFLLFPERSLASSLVPNRDIGIQAQGDMVGNKLFYAAGIFNGIPDGSSLTNELDTNNTKDLAGRIVLQPFRSFNTSPGALNGLGFQVGGSTGRQSGALPSFRTSAGQTYFSYDTTSSASGGRRRASPAVFYYYKAFGAFGEYMRSTQRVARAGGQNNLTNQAWEFTGSFLLTGEAASDRGVRPKFNFDPTNGKWGALQLVGRYTKLIADREAFTLGFAGPNASRFAKSFTLGFNWYPSAFIKTYATYERTVFEENASRPAENVILFRTQLAF